MTSTRDTRNLGGRPATGQGTPITVRMQPPQLGALDAWIAEQPEPRPSRPEAMRVIVAVWMTSQGRL